MNEQESHRPIWPLILTTTVWSSVVAFMGLPLTGGGHGPLQAVVVVVPAPFVFPIGLVFLSASIIEVARGCLFSCLAFYVGVADSVILATISLNIREILEIGPDLLWYFAGWLVLWFGGQIALGFFVLRRWRAERLVGNA